MWDFELLAAIRSIEKSMAYVLYRLGMSLGVAFGYLFAALGGAGTLVGFGSLNKNATSLGPTGALLGFLAFAFLMSKIRTLWLRSIDLPQIGILADQSEGQLLPTGRALLTHAKNRMESTYPSQSALGEMESAANETLNDLSRLHPCPKLEGQKGFHRALADRFAAWLSRQNLRTILAWHFLNGHQNPWRSLADALLVTDRHYLTLVKNRFFAMAVGWIGFLIATPLLYKGIEILISDIPIQTGPWPLIFAAVFAWAIKAAFFDAIAEDAMLQLFFPLARKEIGTLSSADLTINSAAFARIEAQTLRDTP